MNFYRETLTEGHLVLSNAVVCGVKVEFWFKNVTEVTEKRWERWEKEEKKEREEHTDSSNPTASLKLKSITVLPYAWLSYLCSQSLIQL